MSDQLPAVLTAPIEKLIEYGCKDSIVTHRIHNLHQKEFISEPELYNGYRNLLVPVSSVISIMQYNGIKVNPPRLQASYMQTMRIINEVLENIKQYPTVKKYERKNKVEFNPNSHVQLRELFFSPAYENLEPTKKTKKTKQPSADKEVLEYHKDYNKLANLLYTYSQYNATQKFCNEIKENITPDKRIHTTYWLTETRSGRSSSRDPNLQNLPKGKKDLTKLRRVFVADKDYILAECDYSQMELRCMAEEANDEVLAKAILSGDVHRATTAFVLNKAPELVTEDERRNIGKVMNFQIIYGATEYGVARVMKCDLMMAKNYLHNYLSNYFKTKEWMDRTTEFVKTNGYVTIRSGFKKYFPNYQNLNDHEIRSAINCVDFNTEALTNTGWRKGTDIKPGDLLLTKNIISGRLEWQPAADIRLFPDYEGKVYKFKSKSFSALTTPDHRWLVYNKSTGRNECKTSAQLSIYGDHRIHRTGVYKTKGRKIISDDIVQLIGWVVTDGHLCKNGNRITVCQSQRAKPNNVAEIDHIFNKLGISPTRLLIDRTQCVYWYFAKNLGKTIRELIPNKKITMNFLGKLTNTQLLILQETMLKGGGHTDKSRKTTIVFKDEIDADIFQILCSLNGYASSKKYIDTTKYIGRSPKLNNEIYSKGVWIVGVHHRNKVQIVKHQREILDMKLGMWCPVVPNTYFVARREGQVYITGNTPIQGLAGHILFMALIAVDKFLETNKLKSFLTLEIHDSIVMNIHKTEMDILPIIKNIMETCHLDYISDFRIPLKVDIKVGENLSDMEDWKGV